MDLPVNLHESLVESILTALAEQGFRRIIVWRGCGSHDLRDTVERFNARFDGQSRAFLPGHPYHDIWCWVADPSVPGGHADSFVTSIALHLRPDTVRRDRIANPDQRRMNWEDPDLDFACYSPTGVIGDPTHASAELGAKLWDEVISAVAEVFRSIAVADAPTGPV